MRLSVVIPIFNESPNTLSELVMRLHVAVAKITEDYLIIFVDDGSTPDSWSNLTQLVQKTPDVMALRLVRNFGQHAAISAGLDHAEGDWVVVMDGDLEDRPEIIPDLFQKAQEGYEVVFVNRVRRSHGKINIFFSRTFYAILNLLAGDTHNAQQANFSIISHNVVSAFRSVPDRDKFYGGTIRWLGFPRSAISVVQGDRLGGASKYNFKSRVKLAQRIVVGYSTRLLYVALLFGAIMTALSLITMSYVIIEKLREPSLPVLGWPSLMTAVLFTSGITNMMLGLIGLYLGELFNWSKGRPRYIIAQVLENKEK